jgi:glycine hydroxymethyltransferase
LIVAGYSSYPWSVDWARFRAIADAVGAYLLADIAHVAGPIAAGVTPSPVGFADVISFTTHKSLCGPRGAVILTRSAELARRIDRAVFPGEQGGPHINNIVAQAVAFKLAATPAFHQLQRRILDNCVALTDELQQAGLRIPYGGTDTHLTNLDCSSVTGSDGTSLSGDQAARILDLAGIVVNRNTIPGDQSAASPSGVRLGTTWITQRGFREGECREVARLIAGLLQACTPYAQAGRKGPQRRAKVDYGKLTEIQCRVRDLAIGAGIDFDPPSHGYPHFYYIDDAPPSGKFAEISLEGPEAGGLLRWTTAARPTEMKTGDTVSTKLHLPGEAVDIRLSRKGEESWSVSGPAGAAPRILSWLRALSDGFVVFDPEDLHRKSPGPIAARLVGALQALPAATGEADGQDKPWFYGADHHKGTPLPLFEWDPPEETDPRKTALNAVHRGLGAKMVPFAGWDMPVWYSSVLEEHLATRQAAGLFDVSHMGVYQVEGEQACAFLDGVVTNEVASLQVGESLYTQFLDPEGAVIDDTMVYRRQPQAYLVVVNASNDDKDWAWLTAVRAGEVRVDNQRPWARSFGRGCRLRNLRDRVEGADMRVDLALQGPRSREILLALGCSPEDARRLKELPWAGLMEGRFGDFDLVVSRTGYTGERVAFELFVHPDHSVALWEALLQVGAPMGLKPIGLGARDSLRTEAGLPLYGHEMAGDLGLGVGEAGFGAYVKTHKPWFIGREAYLRREASRTGEVARFRFNEKGVRMAHNGDPVVDRRGRVIGRVTSCAVDSQGYLLGQAYLDRAHIQPGTAIGIYQSAPQKADKAPGQLEIGDRVAIPTPATVLTRFP